MKCLPISKALKLYQILGKYLPETLDENLNFIGTIIENIKNSGNHNDYIEAIALMMDVPFDEVLQYDPVSEALTFFVEGLTVNDILSLKDFCKKAGLNG